MVFKITYVKINITTVEYNIMNKKATLSLFLAALIWGLAFIGVENALTSGWQAFPLLMCRGLIGGSFVFLLSYKKKWWKNKKLITLGMVSGTLFFLGFAFQTLGQQLSSVPNSAFITALNILFVPLISHFFLKKEIHPKVYVASVIALIGTAFLTFESALVLHLGDIYLLLCAFFFALQIIYNEKCGQANDVLSITCIQLYTMGILSLICMPISKQMYIPNEAWGSILYLALFSSALASVFQLYGQGHVEPSKASLVLCLESPLATLFSVILLGQDLTLSIVLGGLLIFIGVLLVEIDFKKTRE